MSSYNNITKIKYTGTPTELVTLDEYIMFQDDKAKRKYIIFRFSNNVTQQLLGMQFEVCQYNVDGDLLAKSIVIYNKFLAGPEEEFVPKAKLRVGYRCTSISIRLIQAAYDRFLWKEGEYEDNSYKFDHFFHDEKLLARSGDAKTHNKAVKEEKEKKPKKQKKNKKRFSLRDATRKNLAKFPVFFNVIVFILVIGFVIASLVIFKNDGTKFTVGNYRLRMIGGGKDSVAIYGYTGTESQLVIPEKIEDYTVTKIDGGAFNKARITSVSFEGKVTVAERAFENCASLTSVASGKAVTVMAGAFYKCEGITGVNMPSATFTKGSFYGCSAITSAIFSNGSELTVSQLTADYN